ncbi:MAG: hypothetical protein BWY91_00398 [bacterium ADurb.BinA028]|nr:MAG: hypothetical protein BWY91_00398 [bacterium ADurb.BinA028]
MDRGDRLFAGLAQGVVGVAVGAHRPRAVEREGRGDVLEVVRLHEAQQRAHTAAVELEHPEGVGSGQQLEGALVVQGAREHVEVDRLAAVGLNVGDGVIEDGEVAQAEEVHLDQAELLAARVVELRDDLAVLLAAHDRDEVGQRLAGHDDPGCVHTPLALEALQAERGGDDLTGLRVLFVDLAEVGGLGIPGMGRVEDARQRHRLAHDVGRHDLGQPVAHGEGVAHDPGGVLDGLLGLDGAVGDDLGDPVLAIGVGDVADDLAPPTLVEVDVEVGHRRPLGVEEALEQQPVDDRVEVGDAHGVGAHRTGTRATSRPDPDAMVLGPVDEVGDDEEVARVTLAEDDLDLEVSPLLHGGRDAAGVTLVQPALDLLDEPGGLRLPLRTGESGHVATLLLGEGDVTLLGDQQRVVARLGQLTEQLAHLRRRLEVELLSIELEPPRVHERRPRLHTQQRRVRGGVLRLRVVQVVGRQQRQPEVLGQPQQLALGLPLDGQAVVHDLGIEVASPEDVPQLRGGLAGRGILPHAQFRLDLAADAARGRDEPAGEPREEVAVHPRLEVVAFE